MAKNFNKCVRCRREGVKLFLKAEKCDTQKCPIVRRNYPPGMHGVKGRSRLTPYGIQLREKQKAKAIYGLLEKQFFLYYKRATAKKSNTAQLLLIFLENRLDNLVYRLGLASSRRKARQLVNHGFILVNDRKVNIPSYQVKVNSVISINEKFKKSKYFQKISEDIKKTEIPTWLSFDNTQFKGKYLSTPTIEEVNPLFDLKLIVEFYSR